MARARYRTDLTDAEWEVIRPLLPKTEHSGRPRIHSLREILDAIFYVVRGANAWRLLPHDLPPWKTVYLYFRLWRLDGTWKRLHTALREQLRRRVGREAQPTAGIIDSQSVKTTSVGGVRGFDGAKKVTGRKRHLLLETQGLVLRLVLRAKVHSASVQDRAVVAEVLEGAEKEFPRVGLVWADQGYTGGGKDWIERNLQSNLQMDRGDAQASTEATRGMAADRGSDSPTGGPLRVGSTAAEASGVSSILQRR